MSATVGIVIRTCNRPLLLPRALQSVADQSFTNWQCVIVNDGGKVEAVDDALRQIPSERRGQFQIIHHPSQSGMQNAANAGMQGLETTYAILHDDDDSWHPDFLQTTVAYLEQPPHPTILGVVTHSLAVYEKIANDEVELLRREPFNDWLESISLFRLLGQNTFPPISFLFRRDTWQEIGPYDETWGPLGDWEFNVRFLQRYDIGLIKQPLAHYHLREDSSAGFYANSLKLETSTSHILFETLLHNQQLRKSTDEGLAASLSIRLQRLLDAQHGQGKHLQTLDNRLQQLEDQLELLPGQIQTLATSQAAQSEENLQQLKKITKHQKEIQLSQQDNLKKLESMLQKQNNTLQQHSSTQADIHGLIQNLSTGVANLDKRIDWLERQTNEAVQHLRKLGLLD